LSQPADEQEDQQDRVMTSHLSRRDFLKLGGAALTGLALSRIGVREAFAAPACQVARRVADSKLRVRERSSVPRKERGTNTLCQR